MAVSASRSRGYIPGMVGGGRQQQAQYPINPITGQPDYSMAPVDPTGQAQGSAQGQGQGQSQVSPWTQGPASPAGMDVGVGGAAGDGGVSGASAGSANPGAQYPGPTGGIPPNTGYNPYSYTQPPPSYQGRQFPYEGGRDLAANYANNRNMEQNQGDLLSQYFGTQASQRAGYEQGAQQKSGDLYGQLEQNPGYSPDQANAILGNRGDGSNAYNDLLGVNYGDNYLTPGEQSGISGNPYGPGNAYDPNILGDVNQSAYNMSQGVAQGTQDQLSQGYNNLASGLGVANNPNLQQSGRYGQTVSDVLSKTGNTVMGAANRSDLGMSSGFAGQMNQAAYNPNLGMDQGYAGQEREAYSNPALGITGQYAQQAGMTDQEVADAAAMGGQSVGAQTRASIQDLNRAAAAQGNSDPLAVAAMRSQMNDQGMVNTADATVQAQLAARAQQRQAATGVEQTRLGAQQFQTGAQMQGAQNVENTRLGANQFQTQAQMAAAQGVESTRLGANQYQAGLQASAGTQMGNMALGATNTAEQMRLAALQQQTGMQMSAAGQLGNYAQGNTMYTGQQNQQAVNNYQQYGNQAGMYNQSSAYNAYANAEQQAAQRAAMMGTNRQSTSQSNQQNQYNRGFGVQSQLSGLQTGIADRSLQGQQAVRDYYTGQQQYQGQQGNQANANILTNRAQTQQGVNAATAGSAAWELGNRANPSLGSKVAQGIIGGVIKGATTAAGGL